MPAVRCETTPDATMTPRTETRPEAEPNEFLIREIEARPPAIFVPGHGEVVERPALAPTLVSMLRAAI